MHKAFIVRQQTLKVLLFSLTWICIIACGSKKIENSSVAKEVDVASDTIEGDPLQEENRTTIKIVPVMTSEFPDSNTVHCANVEYLWNAISSLLYARLSGETTNVVTDNLDPNINQTTHTQDEDKGFTFYDQRFSINVSVWF